MLDRLRLKLLLFVAVLISNMAAADFNWTAYPSFTGISDIASTSGTVWFVSAGNLYSFDRESNLISCENKLFDNESAEIKALYTDYLKSLIAVTLDNGYIGLIDKDNNMTVIQALRDVELSDNNVINNVFFDGNNLLVATCSGPVIIDIKKGNIVNSGNYRVDVKAFLSTPDNYFISFDHHLYIAPKGSDLRNRDSLREIAYSDCIDLFPVDEGKKIFGISDNDRGRRLVRYNIDSTSDVTVKEFDGTVKSDRLIKNEDGGFGVTIDNRFYCFDNTGEIADLVPTDDAVKIKAFDTQNHYWGVASNGGLQRLKKDVTGVVIDSESFIPDAVKVKSADILRFDNDKKLIIASTTPYSRLSGQEDKNVLTPFDILDGSIDFDNILHLTDVAVHPDDNSVLFAGSYTGGLFRLKNGKIDFVFDENNSPLKKWWGCSAEGITFDNYGNLWVVAGYDVTPSLMMLPANKTLDISDKNDWIIPDVSPFTVQLDGAVNAIGDIIAVTSSDYRKGILLYNRSTGKKLHLTNFTDTDGLSFLPDYIYRTFLDRHGRLWAVTSSGVFYFKNIESFFLRPTESVVRPKINRDDSTSLADYALSGVIAVDMTEDGAGQKWIATRDEGLYLFNENCTALLEHFTTDNSPLPTDEIRSVIADNEKGLIYVGTSAGLFHVESNAPLAAEDFNDVKIYPNPVKPGYVGKVTVDNLLDNTVVKVVDSSGNNVLSVMSTGGRAAFSASALKSGIYHILATSGEDNSKIVGKLLIIK